MLNYVVGLPLPLLHTDAQPSNHFVKATKTPDLGTTTAARWDTFWKVPFFWTLLPRLVLAIRAKKTSTVTKSSQ